MRTAIAAAGGTAAGLSGGQWIETVREQTASPEAANLVNELGVEAIRVDDDERLPRYIGGVLARLQEVWVGRQIAEMKSKLQRMSPVEQRRRVQRVVRRPGRHGDLSPQPAGAGQRRRPYCVRRVARAMVRALSDHREGNFMTIRAHRFVAAGALAVAAVAAPIAIALSSGTASEPVAGPRVPGVVRQQGGRRLPVLLERQSDQRGHPGIGVYGPNNGSITGGSSAGIITGPLLPGQTWIRPVG